MSLTEQERKAARKETNHAYYTRNSSKWGKHYAKSTASQTGTGNLGEHRLESFQDELHAIEKELMYLRLRPAGTKLTMIEEGV